MKHMMTSRGSVGEEQDVLRSAQLISSPLAPLPLKRVTKPCEKATVNPYGSRIIEPLTDDETYISNHSNASMHEPACGMFRLNDLPAL